MSALQGKIYDLCCVKLAVQLNAWFGWSSGYLAVNLQAPLRLICDCDPCSVSFWTQTGCSVTAAVDGVGSVHLVDTSFICGSCSFAVDSWAQSNLICEFTAALRLS